ncbi:MAG TPA: lipopolysaccharide biosynthesis protein [Elusimicrobiota bacterium]|nr:lipopolysaccharide biosynthesis protein [Elusimicrobiota bacterium]
MIPEHSIKKRYAYKLFANIVSFGMSLVIASFVPRALGPQAYGEFNFLINYFRQIRDFLDMNATNAFYTKFSQRSSETGLIVFYFRFIALGAAVLVFFVLLSHGTGFSASLWPDQHLFYVYCAALYTVIFWYSQGLDMVVDACGLTVYAEQVRVFQKIFGMIVILLLFFSSRLNLTNYFGAYYAMMLFQILSFAWIVKRKTNHAREWTAVSWTRIKSYIPEFYRYSVPLFSASCVGVTVNILDRWLLQVFSGSVQQGFYGLSSSIGALCFVFGSAMTPLLLRDYAVAFSQNDYDALRRLFDRYVPSLYALAAFFGCFIVFQSHAVISIFGGSRFVGAAPSLMIMAFFPIHQTYGQMSNTVLLAGGHTRIYRNIGIVFELIGIVLTYFLIAPARLGGLNAGATGLALKMVLVQFTSVNVGLYCISRLIHIPFGRYFRLQVMTVAAFLAIGYLATQAVNATPMAAGPVALRFFVTGLVYSGGVFLAIYKFPETFGFHPADFPYLFGKARQFMGFN